MLIWSFIIIFFTFSLPLHARVLLCDDVEIVDLGSMPLTESEKLILCGDELSKTYQYVPLYQKEIYLKAYLQARSYLNPKFEMKNNSLIVHAGKSYEVGEMRIISEDEESGDRLKKRLKRLYKNGPLNPNTLSSIEKETEKVYKRYGHACIKPSGEFFIDDDLTQLTLVGEKKYKFGEIKRERIKGLFPQALERFYPFENHHQYNSRLLELTEKRLIRSEIIQATYFTDNCLEVEEELELSQFYIIGPPRTIRFGVGASTELGPMFRFRWTNNRYKEMASKLEASLNLSYRVQSLSLRSEQFFWKDFARRSLYSELTLYRESQKSFEQTSLNLDNLLRWTRDREGKFFSWAVGPSYEYGLYFTANDTNTRTYSNLFLKSYFRFMDHDYEFYDIHPEEGNALNVNIEYRDESLGFLSDALRMSSDYTHFTRLFYWGKGSLIGGVKTLLGTTLIDSNVSLDSLPPVVKFYGGGSDDIRGFDLRALPANDGKGALTKAGAKFELRRTHFYIPTLELFTFYDLVFMGEGSWELDKSYWDSIGVGLRWLSPIGLVQGFIANSYKKRPYENLGPYAFIGLGGTF